MITCPTCEAELEAYLAGDGEGATPSARSFLTDELIDRAAAPALDFDELEVRGRRALDELLALPSHPERLARIDRAEGEAFRNPALVGLLLARSRASVHDRPAEAEQAAELAAGVAIALLGGSRLRELPHDLLAEARAHQADALRSRGDLAAAEALLRQAQDRASRSCDLFLFAEVAAVAAALAKDQGRWSLAHEELDRAEGAYLEIDAGVDYLDAVRMSRAEVAFLSGMQEEAGREGRGSGPGNGATNEPAPRGTRLILAPGRGPATEPAS